MGKEKHLFSFCGGEGKKREDLCALGQVQGNKVHKQENGVLKGWAKIQEEIHEYRITKRKHQVLASTGLTSPNVKGQQCDCVFTGC